MTVKEKLHRLVDTLPDSELQTAERFLEYLNTVGLTPLEHALMSAHEDDEEETEEEREATDRARADLAAGRVVSDEQLADELGL
jgi:hypothetical protein